MLLLFFVLKKINIHSIKLIMYNFLFSRKKGETITIGEMIIFAIFLFVGFYLTK
jgi:hypothetical protein